jgi:hypothetical protein
MSMSMSMSRKRIMIIRERKEVVEKGPCDERVSAVSNVSELEDPAVANPDPVTAVGESSKNRWRLEIEPFKSQ